MSQKDTEPKKVKPIIGADLQELREMLGVTTQDFLWLMGDNTARRWRATGEKSLEPLKSIPVSIMTRYLMKWPEDSPLPVMPEFEDFYEQLDVAYRASDVKLGDRERLTPGHAGMLAGTSAGTGMTWHHGVVPHLAAQRVFLLFMTIALQHGGGKAFRRLVEVVDEEARARGFAGIEEVFLNAGWSPYSEKRKTVDPLTGKPRRPGRRKGGTNKKKAEVAETVTASDAQAVEKEPAPKKKAATRKKVAPKKKAAPKVKAE